MTIKQIKSQIDQLILTGDKNNIALALTLVQGQATQEEFLLQDWNELLSLCKVDFEELADGLLSLLNMGRLQLANQRLTKIPTLLYELKPDSLYLENNQLSFLDDKTGNWPESMEELDLSGNLLEDLPEAFARLNPQALYLNGNQLKVFPKVILEMDRLQILDLSNNQLPNLPEEIGLLKNLEKLSLKGNQLTKLPKQIGELSDLRILDLSKNHFGTFPEILKDLTHKRLKAINLSHNQLESLPWYLSQMEYGLEILTLINNPIPEKEIQGLMNSDWYNHYSTSIEFDFEEDFYGESL